ncbi:gamma-glutamylpolyamine synthetase GlnA3 [Kitasatospora paracochleata]|uniref:Glutamine synthetase n=1 Tax=Kitasatospora paracochleata TaxID=58354 RepID=A0ABT1ISL8_9ACTN|nr:glutamine synthetase family protein [Kitasatospora paracochleata]MCP2308124.1 glutamine synthetase [Kitasatospora paracochleata]
MTTADSRAERAARARVAATRIEAEGVDGVVLGWVDNAGVGRVKAVPVRQLEHAAAWGVGASPCFDHFLVDDGMAPGGGPLGDLRLVPDLAALTRLAAQPGWAWAPVDRYAQDGTPHPGCQRLFARRMVEAVEQRGLSVRAGIEVEWVVNGGGEGPAYGMRRLIGSSDYLRDVLRALHEQHLDVLQLHPEYTTGQFEVSVAAAGPLRAADDALLVRHTVQAVSARHGLDASFAPAVAPGGVGNGAHLHLSLWRDGHNLGHGGLGPHGLTREAEAFLAGVLAELPALLALGAPSVASYLRLVPGRWSGPYRCWGLENREAALRLITGSTGEQANAEVKCFDGAANPYLAVGGVLAAGLAGLDGALRLPPEVPDDPTGSTAVERLPDSLDQAVKAFRGSEVLRAALGEELHAAVLAVREAEIALFAGRTDEEIIDATRRRY